MSLNNEPCINRTTLIDLNPIELNPLIISLDKRNGSCNAVDDVSTKIDMKLLFEKHSTQNYAKLVFNIFTRLNEAKTSIKRISYDCKCKFKITKCSSDQKWNIDTCQYDCKKYRACKKDYSWNPNTFICDSSRHLKHIFYDSVIDVMKS